MAAQVKVNETKSTIYIGERSSVRCAKIRNKSQIHENKKNNFNLISEVFNYIYWGRKWQPTPVFLP